MAGELALVGPSRRSSRRRGRIVLRDPSNCPMALESEGGRIVETQLGSDFEDRGLHEVMDSDGNPTGRRRPHRRLLLVATRGHGTNVETWDGRRHYPGYEPSTAVILGRSRRLVAVPLTVVRSDPGGWSLSR